MIYTCSPVGAHIKKLISDPVSYVNVWHIWQLFLKPEYAYLTIIPRARMGSESIAYEA